MTTKIVPHTFITQSEEIYDKGYDPHVARGLVSFLKPYTGQMLFSLLFMIVVTISSVAGPYFVKQAIDNGISQKDLTALWNTVLIYFVISSIAWIANIARVRLMSRVGQHVLYDVRTAMFHHLQKLSLSFYNRYSVGRVITRVINDVGTLREFVTWAMLAILRDIFAIAGIIQSIRTSTPSTSTIMRFIVNTPLQGYNPRDGDGSIRERKISDFLYRIHHQPNHSLPVYLILHFNGTGIKTLSRC